MRTVTFTMEDALISPLGLAILTGAGIIKGTSDKKIKVHTTATVAVGDKDTENGYATGTGKDLTVYVTEEVAKDADIYLMPLKQGEILSEPIIGASEGTETDGLYKITVKKDKYSNNTSDLEPDAYLVDFYTPRGEGAQEISINARDFAGTYYVEASTLFRDENGVDHPAEFIIPKAKIQSNFTFTMASSGDPSTFTFTLDAFPGYTKFDPTEEVFFRIQVIDDEAEADSIRTETNKDSSPKGNVEDDGE